MHHYFLSWVLFSFPILLVYTIRHFLPWEIAFAVSLITANNKYSQDAGKSQWTNTELSL